jgi:hypothetical protein
VEEAPTLNYLLNLMMHRRIFKSIVVSQYYFKARQLGFTTLICILWLDHALFNANQHCGVIAQNLETVGDILAIRLNLRTITYHLKY